MNLLFPFFPVSASVKKGNVVSLVISIVIYVIVAAVLGFAYGLLSDVPVVGLISGIAGTLIWIYEVVGIVLSILKFVK